MTVLTLLLSVTPAAAKVDPARLGAAHFVGLWSMDGPEGCGDGDTLSFYATGIWAVTNGGGNPVEALGTWTIGEGVLVLTETSVDTPLAFEETQATVDTIQDGRMAITVVYKDGRRLSYQLDRCP
ncbi:MAG TPA: hypothetical protein VJL84_09880 [Kiloniellales bacterium]|nr:hypothetical protein [Kiloniellales bacterium]